MENRRLSVLSRDQRHSRRERHHANNDADRVDRTARPSRASARRAVGHVTTPLPRDQFPVVERYRYFDHAGVAPIPLVAAEGARWFIDRLLTQGKVDYEELETRQDETRAAAAELISLARTVGGHWAMARAAEVASLARELAGDVDGASLVLADTLAQFDSTRMPTQREAIARLEAMRSRLALASGDIATARSSAEAALRAAPPTHVAARASANLAAAAVAHADGDDKEARRLIDEAHRVGSTRTETGVAQGRQFRSVL